MQERSLEDFTDEELREIAEAGIEWQDQVEPIIRAGTSGFLPCPRCRSDAAWFRDRREWRMTCEICEWNAAGCFGSINADS